jgi:hypothetical protein
MNPGVLQKFLTNTDETGRFIVYSQRTGKRYFVEPIDNGNVRTDWGSIDPATKQMMNKKGHDKYKGAVTDAESLITVENGFKNIRWLEPGMSPLAAIEHIDAQYPAVA